MKSLRCCNELDWDLLGRRKEILPSPGRRLLAMAKGFVSGELGVGSRIAERLRDYRLIKGSSEPGLRGGPKATWEPEGTMQSCLHCKVARSPQICLEIRICH